MKKLIGFMMTLCLCFCMLAPQVQAKSLPAKYEVGGMNPEYTFSGSGVIHKVTFSGRKITMKGKIITLGLYA